MRMLEVSLKLLRKIIKYHRKLLVLQEGLTDFQGWGLGGARKGMDVDAFMRETHGVTALGQLIIDQRCFLVLPSTVCHFLPCTTG